MLTPESRIEHAWTPNIRNGQPAMTCTNGGCRIVWWPGPDGGTPRHFELGRIRSGAGTDDRRCAVIVDQPPREVDPCQAIKDDRDRLAAIFGDVVGALALALVGPTDGEREACERILARAKKALS